MKQRRLFILLLLGAVILQAGAAAGCDQIKSAADTAKNTVTSMVDKVNTFEKDQEANALSSAVKEFYNGVVSGSINATTRGDRITASLPDQDAAQEERTNAAENLTILSVLEDQGMKDRYPESTISEFVCVNGEIKYKDSVTDKEFTAVPLSYETPLSTIIK